LKRFKKIDLNKYEENLDIRKTIELLIDIEYDPSKDYTDEEIEDFKSMIKPCEIPYKSRGCYPGYIMELKMLDVVHDLIK